MESKNHVWQSLTGKVEKKKMSQENIFRVFFYKHSTQLRENTIKIIIILKTHHCIIYVRM